MRPYERGAATPYIPVSARALHCRVPRGASGGGTDNQAWLRYLGWPFKRTTRQTAVPKRCLAFAPPPSSPGCDGPKREDKSEAEETITQSTLQNQVVGIVCGDRKKTPLGQSLSPKS